MDSRFAAAWYLRTWTVFGFHLKPFCLLHSVQLEALDSPLETGGEVTAADLLIAAQVCATHRVAQDFKRSPRGNGPWIFEAELQKWHLYRKESCSRPTLYSRPEGSSSRSLNAPWQQVIVTSLIRNTSIQRMEAWTMPEGQALWEFYSLREQIGEDSEILSEETEAEIEQQAVKHEARKGERERICNALLWRQGRIQEGLWPRTDTGISIPFDPSNPDHFPPDA